MSGAYASAVRQALPVHLVKKVVDRVCHRVTQAQRGRRGHKGDPEWINRRRLLRAAERLSG